MSPTLFWYIFKDLIRIFAVAAGVLTGIMSFGGLLKPITEHGLEPAQVGWLLTYFQPAMLTYALPVAALFATTMVYGRLGADNEITACRAAGVSALSIATPAFVLGGLVTLVSFTCLFFVVPRFSLKVEQVIYSNIARLVQNQIERNHRIEMSQPGGSPLTIFAQSASVLPPDPNRPDEQAVELVAPVFVRYEPVEFRDRNKNLVPVPADFYMARTATTYISQDNTTGDLYLRATLDGGMKLPRRTRGGREDALQVSVDSTSFYPDPIESPVRENTKFMEWHRLRELLQHPEKSKRMRKQLNEFIRVDQREGFLRRIEDALNSADNRFIFDTGGEQYVLERGDAPVVIRNERLVIGSLDSTTTTSRLPRLRQLNRSEPLEASAREINIRATPTLSGSRSAMQPKQRWFAIEVELIDATVKSGNTTTPRSRFLRPFSVPMPEDLADYQNRKVEDYRDAPRAARTRDAPVNPTTDRMMSLDRNWYKLTNGIKSEIHARASFAVACWVLVLVGCGLGMMFRSGNFLSAFAISVIPAGLCILLIITGQHTAESVPWDIRNFKNPLQFGIAMIWAGNVVVAALATVLLGRLQRQ